jgi:hypothetical protein
MIILNPDSTVTGVYQGQVQAINIGNIPFDLGAHKIGLTQNNDALTMQAYFDPTLSHKIGQASDFYSRITYIQTGQFLINGTPMPVTLHNNTPPYPVADDPIPYSYIPESSWVDICKYSSEQELVVRPYYPLWIYQNDAGFDHTILFKYPQRYGGFTRHNGQPFAQGDSLCSFLNSQVDLRLLDIPSMIPDYHENMDLDNLVAVYQFPDELPGRPGVSFPYGLDTSGLVNYLIGQRALTPPAPAATFTYYISNNNRYFISYNTVFLRSNVAIADQVNAVIYQNHGGKYILSRLDFNVNELYEQDKQQGINAVPDLYSLNENIYSTIGCRFNFNNNVFHFSYKFTTYACAVQKINNQQINIQLLEGFWWRAGRLWSGNQQGIVAFDGPAGAGRDDEQILKRAVNKFFKSLNINVTWY